MSLKFSRSLLSQNSFKDIDFDCYLCKTPINLTNGAVECSDCEAAMCVGSLDCIDYLKKWDICPNCNSNETHLIKMTNSHRQLIENLKFDCPNCITTFPYTTAYKHIPKCKKAPTISNLYATNKYLVAENDLLLKLVKTEKSLHSKL